MIEIGLMGLIFLSGAYYRYCSNVLKNPINDSVVAIVKTPIGFKNTKQRLGAVCGVHVYFFFKLLLESIANVLGELLYIFQRPIGELRAVHLLLPKCILKRM